MSHGAYYGVFLSFWAGAATGLGAIFVVAIMDYYRERDKGMHWVLAFSLSLAAGVMITVSVVDLWLPLALKEGPIQPSAAVLMGVFIFKGISSAMSNTALCQQHHHHLHHHHSQQHSLLPLTQRDREEKSTPQQRNLRVAAMMFLALTLHNFPEGLAVSVSTTSNEELGFTLALAVAFHNGPEGMAIAAPYYAATGSRLGAIGLSFLSGLSEPFGALLSVVLLGPFLETYPAIVPYVLCVVGGIMIASALAELLPEAKSYGRSDLMIYGYLVGTVTMLATIWVA